MKCIQCGSSIDYRFPTTCLNCDCEVSVAKVDSAPAGPGEPECKPRLKFGHHFVNLVLTVLATAVGSIVGALATYFVGAFAYLLIYANQKSDSYSCARGNAIALLLLFAGAQLGSVCGGILGFANRIYGRAKCCAN